MEHLILDDCIYANFARLPPSEGSLCWGRPFHDDNVISETYYGKYCTFIIIKLKTAISRYLLSVLMLLLSATYMFLGVNFFGL